jgi:Fe-Mn family superoxide dismutase
MSFSFPELPYSYDALEPYIDAQTMEIHYERHHKTYFDKFIGAVKDTEIANKSIEAVFAGISKHSAPVRNNGGGYWNHIVYWNCMKAKGGGEPKGQLADAIKATWGSFKEFRDKFSDAGVNRFGSGFAWLVVKDGKLQITSTPNQDNPLMDLADVRGKPVLALDVWEHAYYLKYQNKRPAYIEAWWNVVNWDHVQDQFAAAMK